MPHFKFPDEYVYWTYIEDHIHVKRELLPIILDIMKNGCLENPFKKCTMKTTITQNYKLLNQEQMEKVIFEPIMKLISEVEDYRNLTIRKVHTKFVKFYRLNISTPKKHRKSQKKNRVYRGFSQRKLQKSISSLRKN